MLVESLSPKVFPFTILVSIVLLIDNGRGERHRPQHYPLQFRAPHSPTYEYIYLPGRLSWSDTPAGDVLSSRRYSTWRLLSHSSTAVERTRLDAMHSDQTRARHSTSRSDALRHGCREPTYVAVDVENSRSLEDPIRLAHLRFVRLRVLRDRTHAEHAPAVHRSVHAGSQAKSFVDCRRCHRQCIEHRLHGHCRHSASGRGKHGERRKPLLTPPLTCRMNQITTSRESKTCSTSPREACPVEMTLPFLHRFVCAHAGDFLGRKFRLRLTSGSSDALGRTRFFVFCE